jgi:predicted Na+-dependent transporter
LARRNPISPELASLYDLTKDLAVFTAAIVTVVAPVVTPLWMLLIGLEELGGNVEIAIS